MGFGTDTGNSIRGPSSHQALVGHSFDDGADEPRGRDAAQPARRYRRTRWRARVADAVAVFQVIVGEDPDDPATAAARGRPRENYRAALVRDGLRGARIGVLRQAYERDTTDPEIVQVFMHAVEDLERAGATIVDPARVEGLEAIRRAPGTGPCMGFKYDINRYLASHGDRIPMKTLAEIVKSGRFHPTVQRRLEQAEQGAENGPDTPACKAETGVSRAGSCRRHQDDGHVEARCVRLSDLEQSAAADRRSQHAARRQQPVLLADDGLPVDPGADGLHARHPARPASRSSAARGRSRR